MEVVVASTKRGKVVLAKQVWLGQNYKRTATCWSEKSFFKNCSQQQQLASSSYQHIKPLLKFLIKTCLQSQFSAQLCRDWILFPICMKRCTTTIKPKTLLLMLQSLQFIIFFAQKLIIYQIVVMFPKRRFFCDHIVSFNDQENIVTYVDFDCRITFHSEFPTSIGQTNGELKNFSRYCKKPKCIRNNDEHNCSFDEKNTSNIFLNPYNLSDMDSAVFRSLNHINDSESVSNQYPQTTTHQPRTDS